MLYVRVFIALYGRMKKNLVFSFSLYYCKGHEAVLPAYEK